MHTYKCKTGPASIQLPLPKGPAVLLPSSLHKAMCVRHMTYTKVRALPNPRLFFFSLVLFECCFFNEISSVHVSSPIQKKIDGQADRRTDTPPPLRISLSQ
mmetsp:Transcript_39001/g.76679  ORF Transcript_39001/g.76679 Transcript_39001/m.76679 type:complete len:101 (-) Transcript_39001:39-341(-)